LRRILGYLISFVVVCGIAKAEEPAAPAHLLVTASGIKWGAPPPVFEKAASFAVISGDPGKPGLFVVRLKLPAGYKIAPHWHPTDEHVTVLSGTLALGMGEKFDKGRMTDLPSGGYALLPADIAHFAMATTAATIQVHGQGPFALTYVNPADDPSKLGPVK
jgi:quercetin dioxygenase-like cupin family protein